jgi:hypothetical protein
VTTANNHGPSSIWARNQTWCQLGVDLRRSTVDPDFTCFNSMAGRNNGRKPEAAIPPTSIEHGSFTYCQI